MGKLAERTRRRKKLKGHGQIGRAGGPKERDSEDAGQPGAVPERWEHLEGGGHDLLALHCSSSPPPSINCLIRALRTALGYFVN